MKTILSLLTLFLFSLSTNAQTLDSTYNPKHNIIQLALLLDVSSSMDGLINQAKSELWNIVLEVSKASKNGHSSSLEIALYEYGRSNNDPAKGYVKKLLDYTSDLDTISNVLFGLRTNGGDEYCGQVINDALNDLQWRENDSIYRVIFIAGNEPFDQGRMKYTEPCSKGWDKGIFINTIHCGDSLLGVKTFWKNGADLGHGEYFFINSNLIRTEIATPYDSLIKIYGDSLNGTYWHFGDQGSQYKLMQKSEDEKLLTFSTTASIKRQVAKSKKGLYKNEKWDVVDANSNDSTWLKKTDDKDLPAQMAGKSVEEKIYIVDSLSLQRSRISKKLSELGLQRDKYIMTHQPLKKNERTLGEALIIVIRKQAGLKGFVFKD